MQPTVNYIDNACGLIQPIGLGNYLMHSNETLDMPSLAALYLGALPGPTMQ